LRSIPGATGIAVSADPSCVDYDVIVVGGGPAGCAFARSMARLGPPARLLLVDRARFPRDKVCGDALTLQAIPAIRRVFPELSGLTPSPSATVRQILTYPAGHTFVRGGPTLDVIPRLELDNALWKATVAAGVETLEEAHVSGVVADDGRVRGVRLRHDGSERVLSCRLLVGADGSRSVVRRATGPVQRDRVIYALRHYVRGVPASTNGLVFLFDLECWGYFWIFPFVRNGERWANVGYGNARDPRRLKERFWQYCKSSEVRRYLGDASFAGRLVGFPLNLARFTGTGRLNRRLWGPGYLLLGDAASLIHPLSGEGISFAIESGRIAAEVLGDDRIPTDAKGPTYERRVLRRVRPVFLSVPAFCAIRVPMLLPTGLSRAYLATAARVHRRLLRPAAEPEDLDAPGRRAWPRLGPEALVLGGLLAALVLFWAIRLGTGRVAGSAYGTRAMLFVTAASIFCVLHSRRWHGWRFAVTFPAVTLGCSLAAEVTGSLTGAVFGVYRHDPAVPGRILGLVPVVVPLAWYALSYLSFATAVALTAPARTARRAIETPVTARAGIAAGLLVGYDLVADPNHVHRRGWVYAAGGAYYGVPFHNFAAWFALGFASFLLLEALRRRGEGSSRVGPNVGGAVLGLAAYEAVLVHESLYALAIAGHAGAGALGLALAGLVLGLGLRGGSHGCAATVAKS
jgi:geranylgeranyl reductase family protein